MSQWMIWKSLIKHHCLKKEKFFGHLDMEDIIDSDYMHAKRVCKDFFKKFRLIPWFLS